MKWLRTLIVDQGDVISSPDYRELNESYVRSIASIDHRLGSGALTLRRRGKLPDGKWTRNGVGYPRSRLPACWNGGRAAEGRAKR